MRKFFNSLWRKATGFAYVIVIAILLILVGLIWQRSGYTYATTLLTLIVAGTAAIAAALSLKWAYNTVRPFLSSPGGSTSVNITQDTVILTFEIQNTGSMPGSDVYSEIDFFNQDEEVTEDNISTKYLPSTRQSGKLLVFPNNSYYEKYILNLNDKGDKELWENITIGKVKFRIRIMYSGFGRKFITIQTEQVVKLKGEETLQTVPVPPQKWE